VLTGIAGGVRWGLTLLAALLPAAASAQTRLDPFHLRTAAASAFMLSRDQRSWLEYDRPGVLVDAQLAYTALPWLDVQFGATGGLFFSRQPGGLAAPLVGLLARLSDRGVVPYGSIDLGIGFTGALLRPFARIGAGVDFDLTQHLRVGPSLGLGVVSQWNRPGYSSSALYAWLGLSVSYLIRSPLPPRVLAEARAEAEPPPPMAAELERAPPAEHAPEPPSPELVGLLDRALPNQKSELLAPVLFETGSDALQPSGVAMLHEVARVLKEERSDVELLEIAAYADARGDADQNRALSRRRAERVRSWLSAHGVAPERLQLSPQGAVDFVEAGDDPPAHQQNRRVVFRILRVRQP
jgi:outer membrane protein OmpA-like peptidoglycan-associated protein